MAVSFAHSNPNVHLFLTLCSTNNTLTMFVVTRNVIVGYGTVIEVC